MIQASGLCLCKFFGMSNLFFFSPLQKSSKGGPGVQSYPNFNPSADVVALDKAITVKGKRNIYLPCYIRTLP